MPSDYVRVIDVLTSAVERYASASGDIYFPAAGGEWAPAKDACRPLASIFCRPLAAWRRTRSASTQPRRWSAWCTPWRIAWLHTWCRPCAASGATVSRRRFAHLIFVQDPILTKSADLLWEVALQSGMFDEPARRRAAAQERRPFAAMLCAQRFKDVLSAHRFVVGMDQARALRFSTKGIGCRARKYSKDAICHGSWTLDVDLAEGVVEEPTATGV